MKFAVGYQLFTDNYFVENIIKRKKDISEIYFSWGDFPNGRNNQLKRADMTPWEAQAKQIADLEMLSRDFSKIRTLKSWCDNNTKTLYALANSGCLNNCSAHTFHDNLVAHESKILQMDNGFEFREICRTFLENPDNLHALFDYTGFIRTEDVYLYEALFPAMKLATRVNSNPMKILAAYIDNKKHIGSTCMRTRKHWSAQ